jgi:hypothetical protein
MSLRCGRFHLPASRAWSLGSSLWDIGAGTERRYRPGAGPAPGLAQPVHHRRGAAEISLFQRAHEIVQAKANKALDAAEKPDEMLDLSYEQMLDQLTKVRQALVAVAASRKQLELQEQQLQHTVDHLQDQAKQALAIGREDLAREQNRRWLRSSSTRSRST